MKRNLLQVCVRFCLLCFVVGRIALVMGQTFQYSRGWTNGKRILAKNGANMKQIIPIAAAQKLFEHLPSENEVKASEENWVWVTTRPDENSGGKAANDVSKYWLQQQLQPKWWPKAPYLTSLKATDINSWFGWNQPLNNDGETNNRNNNHNPLQPKHHSSNPKHSAGNEDLVALY